MAIGSEFTLRLLTDAGLEPGMRVLDVGCGSGDVALIARDLVGEAGEVIGIDRAEAPLEAARVRAREQGFENVSFSRCDIGEVSDTLGTFDAIIGRRVLMYQPDSMAAVAKLAHLLRPGGLVAFQEHDTRGTPALS
jgi:ubiquinone/menaquinone biosynthesis C-methylase UbiE